MMRLMPLRQSSLVFVALTLIFVVAAGSAQQGPAPAPPAPATGGAPLPDTPQVFASGGQRFRVVPVKGLNRPWALAFLPDGGMLITERGQGHLRLIRNGVLSAQPIAGLPPVVARKGLDVAIHPRFAENNLVYFTYYKPRPGDEEVGAPTLARGRFDGGTALTDVRDLFVADAWVDGASATRIAFGRDGKIFMVIGIPLRTRVGTADSAQNPGDHAGKVLRLNEDGSVPADNPFVGRAGYRPEIYALGIRNSIGLIVHPETGEIWSTDNGPQGGDEVNIIKAGLNYGWPVITFGRAYTGDLTADPGGSRTRDSSFYSGPTSAQPCAPGMEQPFLVWLPSIAAAGMAFYTGDKFPTWKGNLFVGGLRGTQLHRVTFNQRRLPIGREAMLTELKQRIREVRQGPDGLLYLLTDEEAGALLRIEPLATSE